MIDAQQLREHVIRPVLMHLSDEIPYSLVAENLLMGTCAQESKMGTWLVQLDNGPAKGIFQMEPDTYYDIQKNYLFYRSDLSDLVGDLCCFRGLEEEVVLAGNMFYAAAMCRVHYRRVPEAMPASGDVEGLARYWKKYYNTALGKGTVEEFIKNYERYVA